YRGGRAGEHGSARRHHQKSSPRSKSAVAGRSVNPSEGVKLRPTARRIYLTNTCSGRKGDGSQFVIGSAVAAWTKSCVDQIAPHQLPADSGRLARRLRPAALIARP